MHIISFIGFSDFLCVNVVLKPQGHCLISLAHIKVLYMLPCKRPAAQLYGNLPRAFAYG